MRYKPPIVLFLFMQNNKLLLAWSVFLSFALWYIHGEVIIYTSEKYFLAQTWLLLAINLFTANTISPNLAFVD